jgi:hypothetical protein
VGNPGGNELQNSEIIPLSFGRYKSKRDVYLGGMLPLPDIGRPFPDSGYGDDMEAMRSRWHGANPKSDSKRVGRGASDIDRSFAVAEKGGGQ